MNGLKNVTGFNFKETKIEKEISSLPKIPPSISGQVISNNLDSFQVAENNSLLQKINPQKKESINKNEKSSKLPLLDIRSISSKTESHNSVEKKLNKNPKIDSILKNKDVH